MPLSQLVVRTGIVLCLAACGLPGSSSPLAAEPEIVFDPPPAVTVRKTDGSSARGRLLSINAEQVTLQILNGTEVELDLDRVRSVQTSGGARRGQQSFEYRPATESFDELAGRARSLPGAKLLGAEGRPAPRNGSAATAAEGNNDDRPGFGRRLSKPGTVGHGKREDIARGELNPDGSADNSEETRPLSNSGPSIENPFGTTNRQPRRAATPREREEQDANTASATEVLVCSNCEKDLPVGFQSGDTCPNCGQVAVFAEESAELAAHDVQPAPQNPFAAPAAGGAKQPFAAPAAPAPVQPAPVQQSPVAADGQGLGLSTMPLIAKVGIFIGFLVIGWFMLQRR